MNEFASRLAGPSDLYKATGYRPSASINFVNRTMDSRSTTWSSYNEKHNKANG